MLYLPGFTSCKTPTESRDCLDYPEWKEKERGVYYSHLSAHVVLASLQRRSSPATQIAKDLLFVSLFGSESQFRPPHMETTFAGKVINYTLQMCFLTSR